MSLVLGWRYGYYIAGAWVQVWSMATLIGRKIVMLEEKYQLGATIWAKACRYGVIYFRLNQAGCPALEKGR